MWLVPQLTAFHQSQAEKSIPLGNTFGFRQLREQRFEKCGLCPITLHFSRPLIGGRQATVVQVYIWYLTEYLLGCDDVMMVLLLLATTGRARRRR